MRAIFIFMIITLYAGYALANDYKHVSTFGKEITISHSISVEHAINNFNKLKNKEILIEGMVGKVCEVKGCWMVLKGANDSIRVTFNDYGFFVPKDIDEKSVQAQGVLSKEVMNISEARHFAKDAGQSAAEIQHIKQKSKEYRFIATAVKILP